MNHWKQSPNRVSPLHLRLGRLHSYRSTPWISRQRIPVDYPLLRVERPKCRSWSPQFILHYRPTRMIPPLSESMSILENRAAFHNLCQSSTSGMRIASPQRYTLAILHPSHPHGPGRARRSGANLARTGSRRRHMTQRPDFRAWGWPLPEL